jgi:hypothetical protein
MAREEINTMMDLSQDSEKDRLSLAISKIGGWRRVIIKEEGNGRTNPQLRFYWAICVPMYLLYLTEYCGWEISNTGEAHEAAKTRWLSVPIVSKKTGEVVRYRVRSTGKLSSSEMADYMENVRSEIAAVGYWTPDPDPCWRTAKKSPSRGLTTA